MYANLIVFMASERPKTTFLKTLKWAALLSIFLTPAAFANVVGNDTQNFNASPSGLDYVTVRSSRVLAPGQYSLGLFVDDAMNTLPYYDSSDTPRTGRGKINDSLYGADLGMAVGVLQDWELGLNLPFVLGQSVSSDAPHGQFANSGNTDIRVSSKYRVWTDGRTGFALVGNIDLNRTEDNPFAGSSGTQPIYAAEIVLDHKVTEQMTLATNLGYRFRSAAKNDDSVPTDPLKNQVIFSAAAAYSLPGMASQLIWELYGAKQMQDGEKFADRQAGSLETLATYRYHATPELAVNGGIGTELQNGLSTPDWRLIAGVQWTIGEKKSAPVVAAAPVAAIVVAPPAKRPAQTLVLQEILFDFDSANLVKPESNAALDRLVKQLNQPGSYQKMVIEGHTCSIGNQTYNQTLSQKRAEAIRRWLIKRYRLDANKIQAVGVGATHPIADNNSFVGREKNRRVELKVFK